MLDTDRVMAENAAKDTVETILLHNEAVMVAGVRQMCQQLGLQGATDFTTWNHQDKFESRELP
jgi:hypothetical protein